LATQVAVAVIRDNLQPPLPDDDPTIPAEFTELVRTCWHSDPTFHPSFLELMTRLSAMGGDAGLSSFTRSSITQCRMDDST
jgi:hypothetical protein